VAITAAAPSSSPSRKTASPADAPRLGLLLLPRHFNRGNCGSTSPLPVAAIRELEALGHPCRRWRRINGKKGAASRAIFPTVKRAEIRYEELPALLKS